ncbi:MAG: phosphomethylpyrimidine synthase, partial [Pyrinomonadaceae bacterium]
MSTAIKPTEIETKSDNEKPNNEKPLPNSRRIYIDGKQQGVRVPFREIDQNQTLNFDSTLEHNPPVRVYDTSGPYGDPSFRTDVREGLHALRRDWIVGRDDVEEYEG